MITVISPAKKLNLNFETKVQQTKPCFQHEANYLAVEIGKLSIPTPGEKNNPPNGKIWDEEHGHFHDKQ